MKKLLVLALVAFFAMTGAAMAENYAAGKAGLYMPTDSDLDSGLNFEAAYGMEVSDTLIGEFALGYATADMDISGVDGDVTLTSISAAALYPIDMDTFEVRVGGGLGLYMWDYEAKMKTVFGTFTAEDDGTEFGFFVQGDAIYELSDGMGLIGEVKYSIVDADGTDAGGLALNVGLQFAL